MSIYEMLSGICDLAVKAIVIMRMQGRVLTLINEWKMMLEYELNTCQVMYQKF